MFSSLVSLAAYIIRQKKVPNIYNPKSLTDKILYKKIRPNKNEIQLRKRVADRMYVREYVSKKTELCSLVDIIWHGTSFSISIWESLPDLFVIKANHGSNMVLIVDKRRDDYNDVNKVVLSWLTINYAKKGGEWVYKDLDRYLIVESFLEDLSGESPPDYKFFCLNGRVAFVQVDASRFSAHKRNLYDKNFKFIDVQYMYENFTGLNKHHLFDDAVQVCEVLSSDFDFIRVDLYLTNDKIYFGELTHFPGNCLEHFSKKQFDLDMGSLLEVI